MVATNNRLSSNASTPIVDPSLRRRLAVTGVVQGVGFRPFVFALATVHGLTGFVGNDSSGVFIEIEGLPSALDLFQQALVDEAPRLAYIQQLTTTPMPCQGDGAFLIVHSQPTPGARTLISPDVSICDACLAELYDPHDRRYGYPFINCTHCGPRFTIMRDVPYDRPLTTMADFPLCPACRREYADPRNRRFHAQPVACPTCGPHAWLEERAGDGWRLVGVESHRLFEEVGRRLGRGQILAIKGLGGLHLACDAGNDEAVQRLRLGKGRSLKPLALMAANVDAVRRIAHLSPAEEQLLTGPERPILLLEKSETLSLSSALSPRIAPGQASIGVMLPYTPLHHLLFQASTGMEDPMPAYLVMTSANRSNEPIVADNDEARLLLADLADGLLLHNRPIHTRCDDSVLRVFRGAEMPIRRSRGYAPFPIHLPAGLRALPPLLAVGGELKSTFCLAQGASAFLSQHIGDMQNLETLAAFGTTVSHFQKVFRIEPKLIVCDNHPGYLSSQWAREEAGERPVLAVQHHHAHVASCMAEHGLDGREPVIGICFDGTGYGDDGAVWGGEILLGRYDGYERLAHLAYVPLAGGDATVARPYRMALAHLWAAGVEWEESLPSVVACPAAEQRVLRHQLISGLNATPTSSVGRLFDAVAALIGVCQQVRYEGQAAIELETLTRQEQDSTQGYTFDWQGDIFDPTPVIHAVVADWKGGVPAQVIAARFHNGLADLILVAAERARAQHGLEQVVLSGGVFQNVTLLSKAVERLERAHFRVLTHRRVPPNDGGLALGQAVVAAQRFL